MGFFKTPEEKAAKAAAKKEKAAREAVIREKNYASDNGFAPVSIEFMKQKKRKADPELLAYEEIKTRYSSLKEALAAKDEVAILNAATNFLDLAEALDAHFITDKIKKESRTFAGYKEHAVWGYIHAGSCFSDIYRSVAIIKRDLSYKRKSKLSFEKYLAAIPLVSISPENESIVAPRSLSDMPEIKVSPIGKRFNPEGKLVSFVVIDVETTGLKARSDKIIELAAVRYEEFAPVEAFSTLINPNKNIPAEVSAINGIFDIDVREAPTLSSIASSFCNFIGTSPLVGYNVAFDLKFLYSGGVDLISKRKIYDVCDFGRKVISADDVCSHKLVDVAQHYNIFYDAHRSLRDCVVTAKVFELLLRDYLEQ